MLLYVCMRCTKQNQSHITCSIHLCIVKQNIISAKLRACGSSFFVAPTTLTVLPRHHGNHVLICWARCTCTSQFKSFSSNQVSWIIISKKCAKAMQRALLYIKNFSSLSSNNICTHMSICTFIQSLVSVIVVAVKRLFSQSKYEASVNQIKWASYSLCVSLDTCTKQTVTLKDNPFICLTQTA